MMKIPFFSNVDLYDCLAEEVRPMHKYTTYDLVSNIVHDGPPSSGSYRIQILHNVSCFLWLIFT